VACAPAILPERDSRRVSGRRRKERISAFSSPAACPPAPLPVRNERRIISSGMRGKRRVLPPMMVGRFSFPARVCKARPFPPLFAPATNRSNRRGVTADTAVQVGGSASGRQCREDEAATRRGQGTSGQDRGDEFGDGGGRDLGVSRSQ
jgi:hypothetical protein